MLKGLPQNCQNGGSQNKNKQKINIIPSTIAS